MGWGFIGGSDSTSEAVTTNQQVGVQGNGVGQTGNLSNGGVQAANSAIALSIGRGTNSGARIETGKGSQNQIDASTNISISTTDPMAFAAIQSISETAIAAQHYTAVAALTANQSLAEDALAEANTVALNAVHEALNNAHQNELNSAALASQSIQSGENFAALAVDSGVAGSIATTTLGGGYPPTTGVSLKKILIWGGVGLAVWFVLKRL